MKFFALVSGGKDSCFNIIKCTQLGHELIATGHLSPQILQNEEKRKTVREQPEELNSFMFQCAGFSALHLQSKCYGVPFYQKKISGGSNNQHLQYEKTEGDEVEDLFMLLSDMKAAHPEVQGVAVGAIFSTYQRTRVENVCTRLGLTPLCFLWQMSQEKLLDEMIESQVEAVVVKVAAAGLDPFKHLGKTISMLRPYFHYLNEKFGFHVCGEGGEYETITLDCPFFKKRLVLDEVEVVAETGDVGLLKIIQCHTEEKDLALLQAHSEICLLPFKKYDLKPSCTLLLTDNEREEPPILKQASSCRIKIFPNMYSRTGHVHAQDIQATKPGTSICDQVDECLALLKEVLELAGCEFGDVCFIHLYLSDMNYFDEANTVYCRWFEGLAAPSRACVQMHLSEGVNVRISCLAQRGTAAQMKEGIYSTRQVLHVRSLSFWAPLCIGPYSQANILYQHYIKLAGQIGLNPSTMGFVEGGWHQQLQQAMKNAASVLSVLDSSLCMALSILVYVNTLTVSAMENVQLEATKCVCNNAFIEDNVSEFQMDHYEKDWNSEEEEESNVVPTPRPTSIEGLPILVIAVPGLPRNALVEVEIVATTKKLHHLLPLQRDQNKTDLVLKGVCEPGPGWIPWPPPSPAEAEKLFVERTCKNRLKLTSRMSWIDSIFFFWFL